MRTLPSTFRTTLSVTMNDLLNDVDQIKNMMNNPKWKRLLSKRGEKNEVMLSRLVFDLSQANDHLLKTKEQLAEMVSPVANSK